MELFVVRGALRQEHAGASTSGEQNLFGVKNRARLQRNTSALASGSQNKLVHLTNNVSDTTVNAGLNNCSESLVGLSDSHGRVIEDLRQTIKVGSGKDAVPATTDFLNRKHLRIVGNTKLLIRFHALLREIRWVGTQHARFVVPLLKEWVVAPHGHRLGHHAHVHEVRVIIADDFVDIVRSGTG